MNKTIHGAPTASRSSTLLAALAVALLLQGCGGGEKDRKSLATSSEEVVIGVAWPVEARDELLFNEGLELALEEINADGGINGRPVRLEQVDDHESVNTGRLAAQQLVDNQEVMAVIGHLQSHVTVPAAAIYDRGNMLLFSPASTSEELTNQDFSKVFQGTFSDSAIGHRLADYAAAQGYQRIAIYYVRSIYGRALANSFEERLADRADVRVVARDSYDANQEIGGGTLRPILSRWNNLEVEAVFLAGEVPVAGRLAVEFRRSGIEVPIIGGDAMSSPALISEGGEAVEGMVVASFYHTDVPNPSEDHFADAFAERYDVEADAAAALAYDALTVLAEAMRRAPTPYPDDVAVALRGLDGWFGATGSFDFDEQGRLIGREVPLSIVRQGRFEYLPPGTSPEEIMAAADDGSGSE